MGGKSTNNLGISFYSLKLLMQILGKSRFNSIYGKDKDSKFPNFSDFDIEPVSEPLHQENISQPQPQYENAQYVESTPSNLNQNQIIQDIYLL